MSTGLAWERRWKVPACQDWTVRRTLVIGLILPALALPFTGCSDGRKVATPPACLAASSTWVTALSSAPDQVLIQEVTPISNCLTKGQSAAKQQEVGKTAVETATQLGAFYKTADKTETGKKQAGSGSAEQAALMAGYLVGAIEKGAEETEGIHATLADRVEAAATNGLGGASQQIQGAYQKGHEAGLKNG